MSQSTSRLSKGIVINDGSGKLKVRIPTLHGAYMTSNSQISTNNVIPDSAISYCGVYKSPSDRGTPTNELYKTNDVVYVSFEGDEPVIMGLANDSDVEKEFSNPTGLLNDKDDTGALVGSDVLHVAMSLIANHETGGYNYNAITPDDSGSGPSLGLLQRHATSARSLLQHIKDQDPGSYNSITSKYGLTSTIDNYLNQSDSEWKITKFSSSIERNCISELLGSTAGKTVQDNLFSNEVQKLLDEVVSYANKYNVTFEDNRVKIFYADAFNQYGKESNRNKFFNWAFSGTIITLDMAYKNCFDLDKFKNRRSDCYNELTKITFNSGKASLSSGNYTGVVAYAVQFERKMSYVFGASGPLVEGGTTDCSNFVRRVYEHFGVNLPRDSRSQSKEGVEVLIDTNHLQQGDLVFYSKNDRINHVAIYAGEGKIIHAGGGQVPKISDWKYRTPVKCRRIV